MKGVVPNATNIINNYRNEFQKGDDMSFSELIILYSEKFYFTTLKRRHEMIKNNVKDLKNLTKERNGGYGGNGGNGERMKNQMRTVVSVKTMRKERNLEEEEENDLEKEEEHSEYEDDDEWETIIKGELERERLETARRRRGGNSSGGIGGGGITTEVDALMRMSIEDEDINFAKKVNHAFRRFDVYGIDLDTMGKNDYDEDEEEEDQGFIMLEDAPDALVAVGLPIEREEAENLIEDLSNGASSDFRGFTLTEFRLVCGRVLSVFQDVEEEEENEYTSRSNKK